MSETYYELPVIKEAPWKWYVPTYFYASGVAGAAATLLPFAQLRRDGELARRLHWIAALGETAGAVCLIADLGRPTRFHHMLRVFRPTSPMNLGTWLLSASVLTTGVAWLRALHKRERISFASALGAITGSMLPTYTGVLIGNTAVPLWEATRQRMPVWFAANSAAGLGSLLELAGPARRSIRVYTAVAKIADLAARHALERTAEDAGVAKPLREGRSGTLWRTSKWLGIASTLATLLPFGGRPRALLAGALGTASSLTSRLAIVEAGRASAADPRATFAAQRRA